MHFIKKNIIIPLVVFIIGMSAVAGIVCSINNEQNKQNRIMANLNAMTYAERIKTDIMKGIAVSDTLRQIIISDDGQINKFYEIADDGRFCSEHPNCTRWCCDRYLSSGR
jgi:hypothetical protein